MKWKEQSLNTLHLRPGELQSIDGYMNIALEKTQEFSDGDDKPQRSYGDTFVRGNNGIVLHVIIISLLSSSPLSVLYWSSPLHRITVIDRSCSSFPPRAFPFAPDDANPFAQRPAGATPIDGRRRCLLRLAPALDHSLPSIDVRGLR